MSQALDRIDKAVARIEAAAARRPALSSPAEDPDVPALREAHKTLRGKVEIAIAQIDRLLEPEEAR